MQLVWRIVVVLGVLSIVCVVPAVLVYELDYVDHLAWNGGAQETVCAVIDHYEVRDLCTYVCNCRYVGPPNRRKKQCNTCSSYSCYNGYARIQYEAHEQLINGSVEVGTEDTEAAALQQVGSEYPLGSSRTCYFQDSDVSDWQYDLYDTDGYLAGFGVFIALLIIGLLAYGGWEWYRWKH